MIGFTDTLKALSVEDMRDYYARFYHPGNATLVICGDIEPAAALATVRKHFDSIAGGPGPRASDSWRPDPSEPLGEQRLAMTWPDDGKRLCVAWPSVTVGTDEDYALDIVSMVLSGGRMARLHRRIVLEQALATSVSTQNDARIDRGAFWVFGECASKAAPAELEAAVNREMERLCDELVPAAELDRAKRMLAAGEAYENETVSDLAEEIGEFATDADWRLALETIDRIRATDAKCVRETARKLLVPARRVVGWCTPRVAASRPKAPARTRSSRTKRARA